MAEDSDSDGWRFSIDEVGPDADEESPAARSDTQETGSADLSRGDVPAELVEDGDESGGNVAGTLNSVGPIEPETPALENATFVMLGVYIGIIALISMIQPGYLGSAGNVLLLTGSVVVVALLSFGVFGLLTPDT